MAGKASVSGSTDAFEYMLFEGDPDHLKSVICNPNQITPWIDSSALKLAHRIGRGPFGDVWLATHHRRTENYDHYHEVAVKMLYPVKEDEMPAFLAKFDEIFSKCQGLENVCFLHGVSIHNGRVSYCFYLRPVSQLHANSTSERIYDKLYNHSSHAFVGFQVCIVMKFYEGSVGDKMAHLKGGKLSLLDVLRYSC